MASEVSSKKAFRLRLLAGSLKAAVAASGVNELPTKSYNFCFSRLLPHLLMSLLVKRKGWRDVVVKICIFVALFTLLFGEFGCFYILSLSWDIPHESDESLTVLLLADPQIQGYYGEPSGILGFITRWDADRYLRRVFTLALGCCKVDAVVIVGDLFDEGYRASKINFQEYKERFDAIFHTPRGLKTICLPGDNDIGGEGDTVMTKQTLERFRKHFGPVNEVITVKDFQFVKINAVTFLRKPQSKEEAEVRNETIDFMSSISTQLDSDKHVIILSHIPLRRLSFKSLKEFILSTSPICSFSGHTHKMEEIQHKFSPNISFPEITVPTCSYRMGTNKIASAVSVISRDGSVQTKMLRFPERYWYFGLYGIVALMIGLIFILTSSTFRKIATFLLK